jgi:hypothetical protein
MIQDICDGAAPAFFVFAIFTTGALSKLAWAAMWATFATTNIAEGGDGYAWGGAMGALAVCMTAGAVSDWAKGRRARRGGA